MKGIRLDKFLAQKYPRFSRSVWQKIIKKGLVLVDQKPVEPGFLLKKESQIKIDWLDIKKPQGIDLSQKSDIILKVIFENQDFLVIEKPAGIVTHPTKIGQKNTLVNAILNRYPEIKKVGDDPLRPGIVHRLDKEVSGLMVIARNQKAFEYFKKEFQNQRIKKEYLALVCGEPPAESGIISLSIGQIRGSLKRVAITSPRSKKIKKEKKAITEYQVITRIGAEETWTNTDILRESAFSQRESARLFSLLKVKPQTGRTHQIRVHLKAIGCPIVGDKRYAKIKNKKPKIKNELNQIFLHANYLGFYNLKGKWQEFKSDLPKELKNFLKNLN